MLPSRLHWPSKFLRAQVNRPLCTAHKNDVRARDIAIASDYEAAEKICANNGWPWPDRNETRLEFLPYAESQLGRMEIAKLAEKN
jgi:hypothetical protein